MARYRLAIAATDDLVRIFIEGLTIFGLDQANHYHDGLSATFEFLSAYPRAARLREEIEPPIRAYPYKSHLILYELDDDQVVILRIRHRREDWASQE